MNGKEAAHGLRVNQGKGCTEYLVIYLSVYTLQSFYLLIFILAVWQWRNWMNFSILGMWLVDDEKITWENLAYYGTLSTVREEFLGGKRQG